MEPAWATADQDFACGRLPLTGQQIEQAVLTLPLKCDQAENLARPHCERNVAHDVARAKPSCFQSDFTLSALLFLLAPLGNRLHRSAEHGFNQPMFVDVSSLQYSHIATIAQDSGPVADAHHLCQ